LNTFFFNLKALNTLFSDICILKNIRHTTLTQKERQNYQRKQSSLTRVEIETKPIYIMDNKKPVPICPVPPTLKELLKKQKELEMQEKEKFFKP
jgi:hypothetical protein